MENKIIEKPKRTLVCGDIHGGLKALIQVLQRCNYNIYDDQLIFLGDYSDGWGETAELVEYLIILKEQATYKPIFIKGNHDEWTREWLNTGKKLDMWVMQGGQATLDSYIRTGYLVKDSHKDFYNSLENYYIDDQNRGFVHGGFVSKNGLGHDTYDSNYYWDRSLWEIAIDSDYYVNTPHNKKEYDEFFRYAPYRYEKHKEIYIGHTATTNWGNKNGPITVPMNKCNVWNLDTGGGFSGKLTIMDIDSKEYFQSDYVKELYPDERGR